jgi:hypothetical protein
LFFILADDTVTYYRAIRLMAKTIDPVAEAAIEDMSQLTLIVSKWFVAHTLDEQIDFLRALAKESKSPTDPATTRIWRRSPGRF